MLATPQGACSARERPAKDGREENRFRVWSFKLMRTHVMKFCAPCTVVKSQHDAGNTVRSSYLKIRSNDDRDFTPKMTFLRTCEIFWEFGMCSKNSIIPWTNEIPTQKRVNLKRLGRWGLCVCVCITWPLCGYTLGVCVGIRALALSCMAQHYLVLRFV